MMEIDGPGVSPSTVNSLALLQLAEAWFRLTSKIAESAKIGLSFVGLDVRDKCAAMAVTVSDMGSARVVTALAARVTAGTEPVPPGAGEPAEDVRRGLRSLPANQSATVQIGAKWLRALKAPAIVESESPWETTELRVMPIRVGGKEPVAQLVSDSEEFPFTVGVSNRGCAEARCGARQMDRRRTGDVSGARRTN